MKKKNKNKKKVKMKTVTKRNLFQSQNPSKKSSPSLGPILWAIDPFTEEGPGWDRAVEVARALSQEGQKNIQPIYILSPSNFNFTGDFSGPWVSRFEPQAQEAFVRLLKNVSINQLKEPKILVNRRPSLRMNVEHLLKFAHKIKAEMILMNSHARKGLTRLFLGSFAEAALMATSIPLILVNPGSQPISQFKKVLFPTDFSPSNRKAFKKVVKFCKEHQSQLIIFHKLPDPIEPMVQTGVYMAGGGWVSVQHYLDGESDAREKESIKWVEEAQKSGVEAKFYISDKPSFITDSINQYITQHHVDLVAVGSKSGPISSVLVGSVARQMVREATCPVWVVHI